MVAHGGGAVDDDAVIVLQVANERASAAKGAG